MLQVALGNGSSVGGGTALVPNAEPDDGRLDVMISRASGPVSRLVYAARLAMGTHDGLDQVDYLHGRQVTISGERFWISGDGEIDGPERRRSWHLEQAAYSMVLPT